MEEFALAKDRAKVLEQSIAGTEEYYYYHCLHNQHEGRLDDVKKLLDQWKSRHGETTRWGEIRNRSVLLGWGANPKKTVEFLKRELGPYLSHSREVEGETPDLPLSLDQSLIARDAFRADALSMSAGVDPFTDAALSWIEPKDLGDGRRRALLERVRRPDHPGLVELVLEDLDYRHSAGFGSIEIHRQLLPEQLDRLAKAKPKLLQESAFVDARIAKLHPSPDGDWRHDAIEREAYLEALWGFVKGLVPAFNSLKVHVLHHRLDHDRRLGRYDMARFMEYLALPRRASWVEPKYLKRTEHRDVPADLGHDFRNVTLLDTVADDEPLVRDYLEHFFVEMDGFEPFQTYVRDTYLRELFAVTKILLGTGDMERWYTLLDDPGRARELKDRVDLEFAPSNPVRFGARDEVALEVDVKNVSGLMVKVFEINTRNYFLAHGEEVDASIDLDGLVAREETTHEYEEPPFRRVRRCFTFPGLSRPGVFVVEFIGGGKSSRALIRKGGLRLLERIGAAGHVFTLLDEDNRVLEDATLWLAGHEYRAAKGGAITVPFTSEPGYQKVLLQHGEISSVASFHHRAESYAFQAGFFVDRESLLKRRKAELLVRPSLTLHGNPVSLSLIEEVRLAIETTDISGVQARTEVAGFPLQAGRESIHAFQVPEDLAMLAFTLTGEIPVLSTGERLTVSDTRTVQVNQIDATDAVDDLHLSRSRDGYAIHLLGKSGELRPDKPVHVSVRHRGFTFTRDFDLRTDENGRVALGQLREIVSVDAVSPSGDSHEWPLGADAFQAPLVLHGREGEPLLLPAPALVVPEGSEPDTGRRAFSLFEKRGDTYVRDRLENLSVEDGTLRLEGLPAGDFELYMKALDASVGIRIAVGERFRDWVLGRMRFLETRPAEPLRIREVAEKKKEIVVRLGGASKTARVHVVGTRFVPAFSLFAELCRTGLSEPGGTEPAVMESHYQSGRDIGDEYRYILERKGAEKFPGNLLKRPGLLLNPWAVRKTETDVDEARKGEAYGSAPAPCMSQAMEPPCEETYDEAEAGAHANLDFLENASVVRINLEPDGEGKLTLDRALFAHADEIHVLAVDSTHAAYARFPLEEASTPHRDLRLRLGLDQDKHFTEKKQVSVLEEHESLDIADITTSKLESYDTLGRVYNLYSTLTGDANLAVFGFVLRWPELPKEEKNRLYSEHASHELQFFLSRKDPEYFRKVVFPYLRSKKDKTFLDRYLLEEDLSSYLEPWAFGRLNAVERILLGKRIASAGPGARRHAEDLFDLLPPDLEGDNQLFATALQGSALDTDDALGFEEASQLAMESVMAKTASLAPMKRAQAGPSRAKKRKAERSRDMKSDDMDDMLSEMDAESEEIADEEWDYDEDDRGAREELRQLYRKLDKTQEWAENNYYKLLVEEQGPELVLVNAFWRDFARHDGKGPFLSPKLAKASRNFTEMMFALSVLDLPFEADKPEASYEEVRMTLKPGSPAVVFHKEIKPTSAADKKVPILVSQNYFRADDRYRYEGGETFDKYVTEEFLVHTVYLCQVVLTNPTSSRQKLDILVQIPRGALPVSSGFFTKGVHIPLESYDTHSFEFAFYFPAPGEYPHFPVHVAKNEEMIASAPATSCKVVARLSKVDKTSWPWISQNAEPGEVLEFLRENNVDRLDLDKIAWRMADKALFRKVLSLLAERHVYHQALWAYALKHGDEGALREYLRHEDGFLRRCGSWLRCPLVDLEPEARGWYEHLEYAPLVNARAHSLGGENKILNDRFRGQYGRFTDILCHKPRLDDADWLAVSYYLLLQDRIEEGLEAFGRVDPKKVHTEIQRDYLEAYAAFFSENPETALTVASRYADHPVDRWRFLFRNVLAQLTEASGKAVEVVDDKDRDQKQSSLASTEPNFEFTVENLEVTIDFQNLESCAVNYYLMDIELLFSRQPFMQQQSDQFAFITPNRSDASSLPAGASSHRFALPKEYHRSNLVVEVVGAGLRKTQAYYAHELIAQVVENWGHVRVTHKGSGKPLPRVYVKAYARMRGGAVKFFKDGYTDLRGRFDYVSLSTDELDGVERFALLVLSEEHGAVIREASPPKR